MMQQNRASPELMIRFDFLIQACCQLPFSKFRDQCNAISNTYCQQNIALAFPFRRFSCQCTWIPFMLLNSYVPFSFLFFNCPVMNFNYLEYNLISSLILMLSVDPNSSITPLQLQWSFVSDTIPGTVESPGSQRWE
jgi:hypothetical protein